jgi:hypothetical protein
MKILLISKLVQTLIMFTSKLKYKKFGWVYSQKRINSLLEEASYKCDINLISEICSYITQMVETSGLTSSENDIITKILCNYILITSAKDNHLIKIDNSRVDEQEGVLTKDTIFINIKTILHIQNKQVKYSRGWCLCNSIIVMINLTNKLGIID